MATLSTACTQPAREVTLPSFFTLKSTCDASIFGSTGLSGSHNNHAKVHSQANIYEDQQMNDLNSDDEELAESQKFYMNQRGDAENRLKCTLFDQMVKKYRFTCSAPII